MRKEDFVKGIMLLGHRSNQQLDYETLMACDIFALYVHCNYLLGVRCKEKFNPR